MHLSGKQMRRMTFGSGRLFTSLFSKLLLVLLAAGLCINLLVIGFFVHHVRQTVKDPYVRNVIRYLNYLIDDMGSPPDFEKAKAISRGTSLQIFYNSPDRSWSTSRASDPPASRSWRMMVEGEGYNIRTSQGQRMATLYKGTARFTFLSDRGFFKDADAYRQVVLLITVLTGILFLAYVALRWILKPVEWLHKGVGEVSSGNIEYHVSGKRSDQLGDLVAAFNQMTKRIRSMLRDRDQLLTDVSHELRTPLTRMKVALEFVADERIKTILREDVLEMEAMVTALLEEARLRHGTIVRQPVDLSALLAAVTDEFADRGPAVILAFDQTPVMVNAAPDLIRIVFRNIIDNALKYSGPAGDPVKIELVQSDDETVVSISDSGKGIPREDLTHIFEPFYRVDKSRSRNTGGYGIGLSLCKTIMDAHGGTINAESNPPDEGTVMRIHFAKGSMPAIQ
jgi:signal transduction histidine kinase